MRSPAVVVLGVGPERAVEMPPTEDEGPVEALGPDRLDHPFRVRVRFRCLDRRADDPDPLRRSTVSNGPVNFASRSRMRNRAGLVRASSPRARLRACWVTHAESGCAVAGLTWIRRLPSSMNTRTYRVRSQAVSTVKKSQAMIPCA